MASLPNLPYELILQTLSGLPVEDIRAYCTTNLAAAGLCRDPKFWRDLIRSSFGYVTKIQQPTGKDYEYFRQWLTIPIQSDPNNPIVELVFRDLLRSEISLWEEGYPERFFILNPLFEGPGQGVIFQATSSNGAIIKYYTSVANDQGQTLRDDVEEALDNDELLDVLQVDSLDDVSDQELASAVAHIISINYRPDRRKGMYWRYFVQLPELRII